MGKKYFKLLLVFVLRFLFSISLLLRYLVQKHRNYPKHHRILRTFMRPSPMIHLRVPLTWVLLVRMLVNGDMGK
jgi:hypothetical protein